ncbi:MAG: hypothetical protein D6798_16625 [Deltaproteobacteria bacterium]|nr:MAG: hypothetical protein D6798_16625 [Deltaproteobacteria bacterium]
MSDDLARLKTALAPVERAAAGLPWADRRPWTTRSHVWLEGRLPVVDLHDLGARQARQAVDAVAAVAEELDAGAVCFVVGRGRHSVGGGKLGGVVRGALATHCRRSRGSRPRWSAHPGPAGRQILVIDAGRAPASATGRPGVLFWAGALLFLAAATFASPLLGVLAGTLLAAYAGSLWWDRRQEHRSGTRRR